MRLSQIADFFHITVEELRRDNREPPPTISDGEYSDDRARRSVGDDAADTVFLPVFVLLPYLPDDMKALYEQFNAAMNSGRRG